MWRWCLIACRSFTGASLCCWSQTGSHQCHDPTGPTPWRRNHDHWKSHRSKSQTSIISHETHTSSICCTDLTRWGRRTKRPREVIAATSTLTNSTNPLQTITSPTRTVGRNLQHRAINTAAHDIVNMGGMRRPYSSDYHHRHYQRCIAAKP